MIDTQDNRKWYLLNCKPQQDQRAEENLSNQGYKVFRPTISLPKKRRGKEVQVEESLFPRYLFIHLDKEQDNWAPIRSTLGVSGIVTFGQEPAQATDTLIEHLRQRVQLGDRWVNDVPAKTYKQGDKVFIDEGPLQGLEAIFNNYVGDERVIVLLNLLSEKNKVTLPRNSVKKSLVS